MEIYINNTTGDRYYEGRSMTTYHDGVLFSGIPSAEQLEHWGYTVYVPTEHTAEERLQIAKENKIAELEAYDAGEDVNSFTIGGQAMWLTVDERQQIATQISASEAVGRETMTRWFGGSAFTFPLSTWKQMLVALEVYAGDAINVTEGHKAAIRAFDNERDVEGYDFTQGYPAKLQF
jgi:hypothetical protein